MTFRFRSPFDRSTCFVGIGILACASAAVFSNARSAEATQPAATSAPASCSATGTTACLTVTNTSSGIGISGVSKSGTGLRGTSTSNNGIKATSGSSYGVYGSSSSGAAGVFGTMSSNSGIGVLGTSTSGSGTGVKGTSEYGYGVYGTGDGTGVVGQSADGIGVYGMTNNDAGVYAEADSGTALQANTESGTAVYANSGSYVGLAAYASGSDPALYGYNYNGNGADISGSNIGIVGRTSASGGYPLVLTNSNANTIFQVDNNGNVSYTGSFSSFARTRSGASARAYVPSATEQTVEDTGSAQLVNGGAAVALDRAFAATIDTSRAYRVFLTPNGDSNGLYVSQKSPAGFTVRESRSGHSTLAFDYRIIATTIGHAGQRMAVSTPATTHWASAPEVKIPKIDRAPALRLPSIAKIGAAR